MRGFLELRFDKVDLSKYEATCEATVMNVHRGSKRATNAALDEIMKESLLQVPEATGTLASSIYKQVMRRADVKGYYYEGTVGYGGNGDPTNPKTGQKASSYMMIVHEDLGAVHIKGKAKFLEDPVRNYGEQNFSRAVVKHITDALMGLGG